MINPTCPECGHTMVKDIKPFTVAYKGLSAIVDMPGWYCTNCDEGLLSGKDMDEANWELIKLKAQADHLLLPKDIRRIRKKLHLTQNEAGAILGGGPNAFHKYEMGIVSPSHAISNLLRLLEAIPSGLEVLQEQGVPIPQNRPKRKRSREKSDEQAFRGYWVAKGIGRHAIWPCLHNECCVSHKTAGISRHCDCSHCACHCHHGFISTQELALRATKGALCRKLVNYNFIIRSLRSLSPLSPAS